ncbi:LysR family transcriptional regulator substrate-binding protein [Novosphingobium decolorationis]|uniref:LysR family transcriptional regulator substrate-binding protein n=1 Tax=Novosphingobium decolorationis TaxID=2698673 RepID=A0ABX8E7E2_9SPHN|nr:LysR family transcriptional regulator substrate-binding protein [Novosphingobium decolorationis]
MRIGVTSSMATGFLANVLGLFTARFPSIVLTFEEASSQANAASVLDSRLDVAFVLGTPQLPNHQTRRLWDEEVYFVIPATHKFAGRSQITWRDVRVGFETHADRAKRRSMSMAAAA